jgi:hypothetical protein
MYWGATKYRYRTSARTANIDEMENNREVAQKPHAAFKAARGNILCLLRSITGTLK